MSKTPSHKVRFELKVKRSKFIGILQPVESLVDFQFFLKQLRKEFHNARHICWAYRFADREIVENSSDAGEPSGSAGLPILNALRSHNAIQTAVAVVRYFGGVKLGKKGLSEAYGRAAENLYREVQWKEWRATEMVTISGDFKSAGKIEYWINHHQGKLVKDISGEQLNWVVELPTETGFKRLINIGVDVKKEANTTKPRR
ncbi:MAG: YigZ family protein [Candidatus Marinimicrobia bacterium]|nr:YigZ family protein [Candidatus Neomarinimicrobiota bacterium]